MSQCSSVLVALLLLTSSAAVAKDKPAPKADVFKGMPEDLQLIGWSKDEQSFAVRKYLKSPDPEHHENCPGYVDHRGKPFSGGLSIGLYEGRKEWLSRKIQDSEKCTPPKEARDKLADVKEELATLKVDLSAIGTVMVPKFEETAPRSKDSEDCKRCSSSTAQLELPSGPLKGQTLVIEKVSEVTGDATEKDGGMGATNQVETTFTVNLRWKGELLELAEFYRSGHVSPMGGGHWELTLESIILSPSGESFVGIGHLSEGDTSHSSENTFIFGLGKTIPQP